MRNILKSFLVVIGCLLVSTVYAADYTFVMSTIFNGSNQSATVTSPTNATVSTTASKSNAKDGKLGSTGNYFQVVLETETFSAVSINGFINTSTVSGYNWGFQFSTDKGTSWGTEIIVAHDGNKTSHDIVIDATNIPSGANGFRVIRKAGTSTVVNSITLTCGGSTPALSSDATLSSIVYGTDQTPVPNFSASKLDYDVELPATYVGGAPSVQVTTTDANATTNITQATTLPGTATITVKAEDGTTTKTYTVTFTKASADPKVLTATWDNIQGSAVIDQVNKTITGQVKNGSSLTLAPSFTGNNIDHWTPTDAQDFSTGSKNYVFISSTTESTQYTVTITESPAVSSDAKLKSLTYGGTSVPNFSPTTYVYNIELNSGIKTPPTIAATANDSKATVNITQASSVPGTGKVDVTAEDGITKLTYTINYTVQVPQSGLTIHVPEIYEAKDIAGGYNGTLRVVGGREYEVYYPGKTNSSYASVCVKPNTQKQDGITTNSSATYTKAKDGWFDANIASISNYALSETEEFEAGATNVMHKMANNNAYKLHVQGFDQFSIIAKDKKIDTSSDHSKPTNDQLFDVYIDNVVQPRQSNASAATIRRYNISTAEHVIEIRAINSGNSELYGFSLRVGQEPRTKYLKGNDTTQVIMQTAAIKPVTYVTKYNNIPGAETRLEWIGSPVNDITLNKIEGPLTDTLVLTGNANCATGVYNYAVVAYYNGIETSRAKGSFTVKSDIKATSEIDVDVYKGEEMDQITFKYYALSANDVKLTWPNTQPAGITGSGSDGKYIIGGTPTVIGTFPFEITVTGADTTICGKINIKELNYGEKAVLFLYKNNLAYEHDAVYQHLHNSNNWNLITRKQKEDGLRPAEQYQNYKWVLISEDVDADNPEVIQIIRGGANLPVLNLKGFTYATDGLDDQTRLGWGEPDNGAIDSSETKVIGCKIHIEQPSHPVFSKMSGIGRGAEIEILDGYEQHGIMPIRVTKTGTLCLATGYTRSHEDYYGVGELQTAIHEVPADMRGGKKYICLPLARTSSLNTQGKKLVEGIVSYITGNATSGIEVPTCQITQFTVAGINGEIDHAAHSIVLNMSVEEYQAADSLKEAEPTIVLADPLNTHVIPDSKELRYAAMGLPKKYTVTDYINQWVYEVSVHLYSPQGIEETYESGMWVNIFDIYGRKVATTNEDIYTMELPKGMYIIVTETGATMKIIR